MRNCQKWSGRLSNEQMIRMQRKLKFKVGNLKNNENVTSHHFTYIIKEKKNISSSLGNCAGKQEQLIKSKATLDVLTARTS